MKIVICGSMAFAKDMFDLEAKLKDLGHAIIIPANTEQYARNNICTCTQ